MSPLLISLLRCLRNQHVFNLRKNTTWKYHEGLSPSHYHVCDCVLEWVSNIHLYLVMHFFLHFAFIMIKNIILAHEGNFVVYMCHYLVYVLELLYNSSPPGQKGRHFADGIFRCTFKKLSILIKISLKFVHKGLFDNNPALIQIMAWCGRGNQCWPDSLVHICGTRWRWVKWSCRPVCSTL